MTTTGVLQRPIAVSLICAATLLIGFGQGSAQADVTAVSGGAFGYSCNAVGPFSATCSPPGPTPTVTLASNASNSPQSASAASAAAFAGSAFIFSSGTLSVSTQGGLGASGAVGSSTSIANINSSGAQVFTSPNVSSSCTASQGVLGGLSTINGGTLKTDSGYDINNDGDFTDTGEHAPVVVNVPPNPVPNTLLTGHIHIGNSTDNFRYVFNEQVVNVDGSITVNAAHQYFDGPLTSGNLIIGQSRCGVTATDTTPPQTTINSGPSGTIATNTAAFSFSSSEAPSTFECKLDGPGAATGTFGACTSPKTYSSLADGPYTFSVRAKDAANNTDQTPATRSFTISTTPPPDTTPPQTTIDSGPSGTIATNTAAFTFSSSEAPSTFECKLDGPGAATGTFGACTSPKTYSSLANGAYTFSVRAKDASNNTDQTPATRSFTISTTPPPDTTPPQTTIDSGPSGTIATNTAAFTFSSSEAPSTFECKLDGPGAATGTFGACTSPKTYSSLANGAYTFSVRAKDASNNTDATPATRSFTVAAGADPTPPQTTIDSGPSGTIATSTAAFTFSSSEAGSTVECKLDGPGAATGTFGACTSPKTYSSLANGAYTFSVRATDAANNTDATPATRTFTVAVPGPNGQPLPPAADTTKPLLSSLSLSPARFRAAGSGPSIAAAAVGSTVSYRLSEPATVGFKVERARAARRAHGRCVKPTRSNRRGRRCTRYVTLRGGFAHQGNSGLNQFRFSGRLRGRKLAPGRYRLRAVATDPTGNVSLPLRSGFRIVRR